jgi:GNAT superfamily N-acetyltransferase
VIVRKATADDDAILAGFIETVFKELWDRPWPPPEVSPDQWRGKIVLLAEDGDEPIGCAFGEVFPNSVAHVNIVYVRADRRRQGIASELLRVFSACAREAGAKHLTLDVDTTNEVGRAVWRRLGFSEWAHRLTARLDAVLLEDCASVDESD